MKPSVLITLFCCVIVFSYIMNLYERNESLYVENGILEYDNMEKDKKILNLEKKIISLKKVIITSKEVKTKIVDKPKRVKPKITIKKDTIINVIDTSTLK